MTTAALRALLVLSLGSLGVLGVLGLAGCAVDGPEVSTDNHEPIVDPGTGTGDPTDPSNPTNPTSPSHLETCMTGWSPSYYGAGAIAASAGDAGLHLDFVPSQTWWATGLAEGFYENRATAQTGDFSFTVNFTLPELTAATALPIGAGLGVEASGLRLFVTLRVGDHYEVSVSGDHHVTTRSTRGRVLISRTGHSCTTAFSDLAGVENLTTYDCADVTAPVVPRFGLAGGSTTLGRHLGAEIDVARMTVAGQTTGFFASVCE